MDNHTRKQLKAAAAQAIQQGWKAIPVAPAAVLELVRGHTPPPDPTQVEQDLSQAHRTLASRDTQIRTLEQAVKSSYDRGAADAHRSSAEEIKRLREELAQAVSERNRMGLELNTRPGRKREVGTAI